MIPSSLKEAPPFRCGLETQEGGGLVQIDDVDRVGTQERHQVSDQCEMIEGAVAEMAEVPVGVVVGVATGTRSVENEQAQTSLPAPDFRTNTFEVGLHRREA